MGNRYLLLVAEVVSTIPEYQTQFFQGCADLTSLGGENKEEREDFWGIRGIKGNKGILGKKGILGILRNFGKNRKGILEVVCLTS
jgi:hypothetical protein